MTSCSYFSMNFFIVGSHISTLGLPRRHPGNEFNCKRRRCRRRGEGSGHPLSILAWEIPRMEAPGGIQSLGSQRADTREHSAAHFNP